MSGVIPDGKAGKVVGIDGVKAVEGGSWNVDVVVFDTLFTLPTDDGLPSFPSLPLDVDVLDGGGGGGGGIGSPPEGGRLVVGRGGIGISTDSTFSDIV